jgi:hypothetical protein
LISRGLISEFDGAVTKTFTSVVFAEQAAENRIGIEAGQATPYDLSCLIYQCPDVAISD